MYIDAISLFGWAMSPYVLRNDMDFDGTINMDTNISTADDAGFGNFVEIDFEDGGEAKQESISFLFCLQCKQIEIKK